MFSRKIIWLALCAALPVSLHALAEEVTPPAQQRVLQEGAANALPGNGEPVDVLLADPDGAYSAVAVPAVKPEPAVEAPESKPVEIAPEVKQVEAAPDAVEPQPVPVAEVPEVKAVAEPAAAPEPQPQPEAAAVPAVSEVKPAVAAAVQPEPAVEASVAKPVEPAPEVKPVEATPVAVEPEPAPVAEVPELKAVAEPAAAPEPEAPAVPVEPEVKPAEAPAVQPEPAVEASVTKPVEATPVAAEPQPVPVAEIPEIKAVAESVPATVPAPEPEAPAVPVEPEVKPAEAPAVKPEPAVEVPKTKPVEAAPVAIKQESVSVVKTPEPRHEVTAVSESMPASADAPSKAFAAAQASVKSAALEKPPEFKPVVEVKPHVDSAVMQGGPLQAGAKPSAPELLERAKYWDSRGRRDIADKLRNQYRQETHQDAADAGSPVSARNAGVAASGESVKSVARTSPVAKTVVAEPVAPPTRQELLERAKYWEVRGRTDLAEKISAEAATPRPAEVAVASEKPARPVGVSSLPATPAAPVVPVAPVVAAAPAATVATAARPVVPAAVALPVVEAAKPDSDRRAQYWAARGRSDLAQGDAVPAKAAAPVARAENRVQLAVQDKAEPAVVQTAQQLDASAQYWDARGRPDLASQVRAKLQQIEPASRPRGDVLQRTTGDDGRSALEDSLLKNPNSLKARLDLAQIYKSAGELARAREMIDSVLRGNPDLPDALYASAQLYAEQHLWWEVLHTLEKVSPVSRTAEMGRLQKIGWAHVQIDRADALVRQGDNAGAEVLLRRVAAELVVSNNQAIQPEPPPLWNSGVPAKRKGKH